MTLIWVKFQLEGFHYWKEAPPNRRYLQSPHRHMFHFEVSVQVDHPDRQVEFHDLRDNSLARAELLLQDAEVEGWSCETIAKQLFAFLKEVRGLSVSQVEVSEDGECGAVYSQ